MNTFESLVFRPYGAPEGAVMLVLRTHDLYGTDYEPLFRVGKEDARGIVAGCSGIRFLYGDPAPGSEVRPVRLPAVKSGRSGCGRCGTAVKRLVRGG